jgi:hypothetical protein
MNDDIEDDTLEIDELITYFTDFIQQRINIDGRLIRRLIIRQYNSYEYAIALEQYKNLCNNNNELYVSENIVPFLNIMLNYYNINDKNWPSKEYIITQIKETYQYFNQYNIENINSLLDYYFFTECRIPSDNEMPFIIEYFITMKEYPDLVRLEEYIINVISFLNNPEEYHQQDKIYIPVEDVSLLSVVENDLENDLEDVGCSICQDDILLKQSMIKLNCNHYFHSSAKDCLIDSSIYTWFEQNSTCPVCGIKVSTK